MNRLPNGHRIAQHIHNVARGAIGSSRNAVLAVSVATGGLLASAPLIDASGAPAAPIRPLNLSCETTFAFTSTGSIHIEGTCHYSHLGLTTTVAEQILIPQPDGTFQIVNTAVDTAANGDELYSTTVGTGAFTPTGGVVFSGTETYNGGTGRFVHATGSAALTGSAQFTSPSSGVGQFSGQGTLAY